MSHMNQGEEPERERERVEGPAPLQESFVRETAAVYRVKQVRDGLLFWTFDVLREQLGVTEERLAELLDISRATLHRRKKIGQLGTPALAFHWETPLDYADTEIGAQAVEQLLGRIEHGIFS